MRLLFVTTYYPPNQGATATMLARVVHHLRRRGHEITVLTTLPHYPQGRIAADRRGRFSITETEDGVRVIQTWLWATPSPRISRKLVSQLSFMLTAALRGLPIPRPDVTFVESQPIFASLAGAALSRLKGVPYILDVSDLWPDHLLTVGALRETHPVYRTARAVVDATYRGAAAIVTASPTWAEIIRGYIGSADKLHTIYYGTDLDRFRPGLDAAPLRARYSLDAARLVTFIGTFATQYDFEQTLDVAAYFRDRADVRFAFLGSGSQDRVIRERLGRGDLNNVVSVGWVDYADMPLAWAASSVTYWALRDQPLYRGTIPGKLFEAMASGVPIAAAAEGVAAGMIRESGAGLTVPFGDVAGLAEAVRRLLDDPALHEACGHAGRAYAEQHFDPEQLALAYEAVLARAAAG